MLSAQRVCELYPDGKRVEDAFLLTKRLLGLAYIWVGDTNGVQITIVALSRNKGGVGFGESSCQ